MPANHWAAYEPDAKQPWTLSRVVHLHRRAAWAGTWDELQRDLKDGPALSIQRLRHGQSNRHSAKDFDSTAQILFESAVFQNDIGRLKAAWIYRFLFGPDPLREKLTMLWHDHFATANSKVNDVGLMRKQNETLRTYATGEFGDLLNAALRDPALLLYLDAPTNRKGHANENLGRELMELFTLGVGNYTEADVKEAARALTGWSVDNGQFVEQAERHDEGVKSILGTKGPFNGSILMELLLKQPMVAERIVGKLIRPFFGDTVVSAEAKTQLADGLREQKLNVGWAIDTILNSRLFFSDANLRCRALNPIEFIVGAARMLELFDPAPNTLAMADWSAHMGLDLFDPPNVGGWPGGSKWIHSRSLIARANYVAALVTGPNVGRTVAYDPNALAKAHGFGSSANDLLTFHHRLQFGTDPTKETHRRFVSMIPSKIVIALLSSPDAQIG